MPRDEAIIGVPEDRIVRSNFGKDIELDLSSTEHEFESFMFPVNRVFDWDEWKDGFGDYWIEKGDPAQRHFFRDFQKTVLDNFKGYHVPVIALDRETSKEAVCLVFEKVNTGGKALDAFELVTAIYAAEGFRLRDDWAAREARLKVHPTLTHITSSEFMQAISLLPLATENHARPGRMDDDLHFIPRPLDLHLRDRGGTVLGLQVSTDLEILKQQLTEILLGGIPSALPRLGDTGPESDGIDFLAHVNRPTGESLCW